MTNAYSVSPQQIVSDAERFLRALSCGLCQRA